MKKRSLIYLSFLISCNAAFGQQQLTHEKHSFVDSLGRYYQQATQPVYLFVSTSTNGSPIPLQAVDNKEIQLEGHGMHSFKHEII